MSNQHGVTVVNSGSSAVSRASTFTMSRSLWALVVVALTGTAIVAMQLARNNCVRAFEFGAGLRVEFTQCAPAEAAEAFKAYEAKMAARTQPNSDATAKRAHDLMQQVRNLSEAPTKGANDVDKQRRIGDLLYELSTLPE